MNKKIYILVLLLFSFTFIGCNFVDLDDSSKFRKEEQFVDGLVLNAETHLDADMFRLGSILVDIGEGNSVEIKFSSSEYDQFESAFGEPKDVENTAIPLKIVNYFDINTNELYFQSIKVNY